MLKFTLSVVSFVAFVCCMLMGIFSAAGICALLFGPSVLDTVLGDQPDHTHPAYWIFLLTMVPGMMIGACGGFFGIVVPFNRKFGLPLPRMSEGMKEWIFRQTDLRSLPTILTSTATREQAPSPSPRLGAYAILLDGGKILLCRLCNPDKWHGHWTLPGGSLEFGESPEQAMIREVEEETGFIARPTAIAGIDTIHDSEAPYHGVRVVYHAEITGGTLRHETSGSTDRCEWHELSRLHEIGLVDLLQEIVKWEWNPTPPTP